MICGMPAFSFFFFSNKHSHFCLFFQTDYLFYSLLFFLGCRARQLLKRGPLCYHHVHIIFRGQLDTLLLKPSATQTLLQITTIRFLEQTSRPFQAPGYFLFFLFLSITYGAYFMHMNYVLRRLSIFVQLGWASIFSVLGHYCLGPWTHPVLSFLVQLQINFTRISQISQIAFFLQNVSNFFFFNQNLDFMLVTTYKCI